MKSIIPLAFLALAACAPQVPNSAAGVGFGDYEAFPTEDMGDLEVGPVISSEVPGSATAAAPVLNNPDISDEQDFDAVAERQTIESDAARLERLRREYTVIQPRAVPQRSGSTGPNIVAFALGTSHSVGQSVYSRSGATSAEASARACAGYVSTDAAQRAFLARGGPERDRLGLDPDGDGYACGWDPAPFRAARG